MCGFDISRLETAPCSNYIILNGFLDESALALPQCLQLGLHCIYLTPCIRQIIDLDTSGTLFTRARSLIGNGSLRCSSAAHWRATERAFSNYPNVQLLIGSTLSSSRCQWQSGANAIFWHVAVVFSPLMTNKMTVNWRYGHTEKIVPFWTETLCRPANAASSCRWLTWSFYNWIVNSYIQLCVCAVKDFLSALISLGQWWWWSITLRTAAMQFFHPAAVGCWLQSCASKVEASPSLPAKAFLYVWGNFTLQPNR